MRCRRTTIYLIYCLLWILPSILTAQFLPAKEKSQVSEPYELHIRSFKVQYPDGGEWKTIFEAENAGSDFMKQFPPVEARSG